MAVDLAIALPFGILAALVWALARRRGDGAARKAAALLAGGMLLLVATDQLGARFDGYVSDLWLYLTIADRVAEGLWLFDREPFGLEPPGAPLHSIQWLAVGLLQRATGLPGYAAARILGLLAIGLLSGAAWLLARRAFATSSVRWLALILFWASLQQSWPVLALNRNLALGCVLLAIGQALDFRGSRRDEALLAASVAGAFALHVFAGVLAGAAVALAGLARAWHGEPLPLRRLAAALGMGGLLAAPWLALGWPAGGGPLAEAHLGGPGQLSLGGLRVFHPGELLHQTSPAVLLLAAFGLRRAVRGHLPAPIATLVWMGPVAVAVLLAPPLYHLATSVTGGWMLPRALVLALLWIPATATLASAAASHAPLRARAAAALGIGLVFWLAGARVVRDFRHPELHHPVSAEARREARSLRALLHGQRFLSTPHLAYGLTPWTGGLPLAVPPGHASPVHPVAERARESLAVLAAASPACWKAFLTRHPDVAFLVTPAAGAAVEERLWRGDLAQPSGQELRARLASWRVGEPVFEGRHFVVDALRPEALAAADGPCA